LPRARRGPLGPLDAHVTYAAAASSRDKAALDGDVFAHHPDRNKQHTVRLPMVPDCNQSLVGANLNAVVHRAPILPVNLHAIEEQGRVVACFEQMIGTVNAKNVTVAADGRKLHVARRARRKLELSDTAAVAPTVGRRLRRPPLELLLKERRPLIAADGHVRAVGCPNPRSTDECRYRCSAVCHWHGQFLTERRHLAVTRWISCRQWQRQSGAAVAVKVGTRSVRSSDVNNSHALKRK
jgi:hypothetical protein